MARKWVTFGAEILHRKPSLTNKNDLKILFSLRRVYSEAVRENKAVKSSFSYLCQPSRSSHAEFLPVKQSARSGEGGAKH
jgi:hypothetical protein